MIDAGGLGMRVFRALLGVGLAVCLLLVVASGAAAAGGVKLCVPTAEATAVLTPTGGACKAGYTLTELGAEGKEGKAGAPGKEGVAGKEGAPGKEGKAGTTGKEGPPGKEGKEGKQGPEGTFSGLTAAEKETLLAILPEMKFVKEGVDKKPTIQFSGANVQGAITHRHPTAAAWRSSRVRGAKTRPERVTAVIDAEFGIVLRRSLWSGDADEDADVAEFLSLDVGGSADPSAFAAPAGYIDTAAAPVAEKTSAPTKRTAFH